MLWFDEVSVKQSGEYAMLLCFAATQGYHNLALDRTVIYHIHKIINSQCQICLVRVIFLHAKWRPIINSLF